MRKERRKKRLIAGLLCMLLLFTDFMSIRYVAKAAEIENEQSAENAEQKENATVNVNEDEDEEDFSENDAEQSDSQEENTGTEDNVENSEDEDSEETESGDGVTDDGESSEKNDGTLSDDKENNENSETENGGDTSDKTDIDEDDEEEINQDRTCPLSAEERLKEMSSEGDIAGGTYRDTVWVIDANGKLTVEGTGNYSSNGAIPGWYKYKESILYAEINLKDTEYATSLFLIVVI